MSHFEDPGTSSGINWTDLNGNLLIIDVSEHVIGINTVHGPSDAVRATVTVVDGDNAGAVYNDTLVFPKVLQAQLASKVSKRVLGRLGQGQAKPGQSAPWVLNAAGPGDSDKAEAFLAKPPVAQAVTAADLIGEEPF